MKIVFLDFDDIKNPLLNGGQAIATYQVGKHLVERGHGVTVLSSRYPGFKDRIQNGIKYKHIGLGSPYLRLNNLIYFFSVPFALFSVRADILVECFTAPISTLFSPLWTKIPVVALPSSFDADRFSKKYKLPFTLIEKIGCRFYKYFLPYSKYIDKKMKNMNPNVTSLIVPEGVGEEFFTIKKKKPKYILFLGRMDIHQKGIDLLLQAYAKICDKIPYPLVIAGNGPDEDEVKALVHKLKLDKKVIMTGATYGTKKKKVLSESLFCTFTSRTETFSCFALEALASGVPLLAFDIPGLSWTDKKSTKKVTCFDVDAYAQAIYKMATNKDINIMSKHAREYARNFSWESVSEMFEKFFVQIVNKPIANKYIYA